MWASLESEGGAAVRPRRALQARTSRRGLDSRHGPSSATCVHILSGSSPDTLGVQGPVQRMEVVETDKGYPKENKQAIYLEVATARTRPPSSVFWQRLKGRQESGKVWSGKGEAPCVPGGGLSGRGRKLEAPN